MDAHGFLDVTPEDVALHIARTMRHLTPDPDSRVIEGCSGYGGNTISFIREGFRHVVAIDTDASRVDMAKRNARVYQIPEDAIEWVQADVAVWCGAHTAEPAEFDWAFISPPWGGEGYKNLETFRLRDTQAYEMVLAVSRVARNVAIYIPVNQDRSEIAELASDLPNCAAVVVEHIAVGLKQIPKYIVAYFLDEATATRMTPSFQRDVARLLVVELEEAEAMRSSFEFLLQRLGSRAVLQCLRQACEMRSAGGVRKIAAPDEQRSKGGVFFFAVKERHVEAYRDLNKFRKLKVQEKRKEREEKKRKKKSPDNTSQPSEEQHSPCLPQQPPPIS